MDSKETKIKKGNQMENEKYNIDEALKFLKIKKHSKYDVAKSECSFCCKTDKIELFNFYSCDEFGLYLCDIHLNEKISEMLIKIKGELN